MPPASRASTLFGERVRSRRLALGLSQEQVAELAALSPSNFGKIERGLSNPSLHTIVAIASALGTEPGLLLVGIGNESLPSRAAPFSVKEYIREKRAQT